MSALPAGIGSNNETNSPGRPRTAPAGAHPHQRAARSRCRRAPGHKGFGEHAHAGPLRGDGAAGAILARPWAGAAGTLGFMPETQVATPHAPVSLDDPWRQWHERRHPAQLLHLDTAAAGRCSAGTLRAAAEHAEREAGRGAYVAQDEAGPVLEAGRAGLAGMLGVPPEGVAFVESATAALRSLLTA